jgi:hypothetical protein
MPVLRIDGAKACFVGPMDYCFIECPYRNDDPRYLRRRDQSCILRTTNLGSVHKQRCTRESTRRNTTSLDLLPALVNAQHLQHQHAR